MWKTLLDMTNRRYERIKIIDFSGRAKDGHARWVCLCDCGKKFIATGKNIRRGDIKSCGCLNDELRRKRARHGHARKSGFSGEYKTWAAIKARCCNPDNPSYAQYGKKGITMCNEWAAPNGFDAFIKDMGKKPSLRHSIDRIDNDKGYFKENCRWANQTVQCLNQSVRKDNKTGVKGVAYNKRFKSYVARLRIYGKQIHLGSFKTIEEAAAVRRAAEEKYHKPILDAA